MTREDADFLIEKSEMIAVAESCTGGLVGAELSSFSGSTSYFWGGVLVYHNQAKHELLGVRQETLQKLGAVSQETLCEMLDGLLERYPVEWALAVTGVAGPGGGSKRKPVGTVWLGVRSKEGQPVTEKCQFPGNREEVRKKSVDRLLQIFLDEISRDRA